MFFVFIFSYFFNQDLHVYCIIARYTIYNYQRKSGGTGYDYKVIQGVFSLASPKKLKYGKPRLGESTLT